MIIQVKDLRVPHGHGGHLSNVSFCVEPGEILYLHCRVLLLGTVLLRAVMGLDAEARGEVWFERKNLLCPLTRSRSLKLREQMALVYRERGLVSLVNVEENIALPLGYHYNINKEKLAASVREVAERLDILDLLPLNAQDLDEPRTRLVNLARALIRHPRLVLIDGLFEGMRDARERVLGVIKDYQQREGFGVVMTGRDPDAAFATRALMLRESGLGAMDG